MIDKDIKEWVTKEIKAEAKAIEEHVEAYYKANPHIERELDERIARDSKQMWEDLMRRIEEGRKYTVPGSEDVEK